MTNKYCFLNLASIYLSLVHGCSQKDKSGYSGQMLVMENLREVGLSMGNVTCFCFHRGLVVNSHWESLERFKRNLAHEHEELKDFVSAVKV